MLFSSLIFIFLFLPLFFLLYYSCRKRSARNVCLLVFSLLFYAWGEPLCIFLMLASILFNYVFAVWIDKYRVRAKFFLAADIILNLGLLAVFKYLGFIVELLNCIPLISLPGVEIALPIGISFYTFQIMSYVIDVYWKKVPVQKNILTLGTYLSAFPQLIAGPIVRYQTVVEELDNRQETLADITDGMRRFIAGLAKKVLISNIMAQTADVLFAADPAESGAVGAWIAAFAYTLHIYFDFSGYSDMAIGLGRMMGFHYLENFNYPYTAKSVTDFWRRWHISLSTFFRDYVYIPLGGNRVSQGRHILNLLIVWALTGLWHGASMNYIIWGLYFGIILILEKLFWGRKVESIPVIRRVYTMFAVVCGWIIFRCESLGQMGKMFRAMFGGYGFAGESLQRTLLDADVSTVFLIAFAAGVILSMPLWPSVIKPRIMRLKCGGILCDIAAVAAFLLSVAYISLGAYNPFIYFRF